MFHYTTDNPTIRPNDPINPIVELVPIEEVEKRLSYEEDRAFYLSIKYKLQ